MKKENFKKILQDGNGEIPLMGYGLTKGVFLGGIGIGTFDWGYHCTESIAMGREILKKFVPLEQVKYLAEDFSLVIASQLPRGNFNVILKLQQFLDAKDYSGEKHLHAYNFIDIYVPIGNIRFSKFLDFPSMNIDRGEFESDTVEFKLIKNMTPETLSAYKEYIVSKTKRKSILDADKEVHAKIELLEDKLLYVGGGGTELHYGHKANYYEY